MRLKNKKLMVNGFAPLLERGGRGRGRYFKEERIYSKKCNKFQDDTVRSRSEE